MIKAIFWDNDGVLVDTDGIFFRANRETLADLGISLGWEQFEEISLVRGGSVLQLTEKPGTAAFYKLRDKRDALYADLLTREPLVIEGVCDVLEALTGKYAMGIVTSSGHEHFEIIHRRSGLLPYFQFALTMKDCSRFKPHPEPYLKAIALSGCRRGEISRLILAGRRDAARAAALWYRRVFGERFFIEIQRLLLPYENHLIHALAGISSDLGIPLAAANNVHYLDRAGLPTHDILTCVRTLTKVDQPSAERPLNAEQYLLSPDEFRFRFRDYPEAVAATDRIAAMCDHNTLDISSPDLSLIHI